MKTNFKIIIAVIAMALITVSCGKGSSIDAALSQIEKAMDKVEKNKTSMTEADWEALHEELEQSAKVLAEALESNQVGVVKKAKISMVMMRYVAVIGEAAMHTMKDALQEQIEEAGDNAELKELLESDELKQAMEALQTLGQ